MRSRSSGGRQASGGTTEESVSPSAPPSRSGDNGSRSSLLFVTGCIYSSCFQSCHIVLAESRGGV